MMLKKRICALHWHMDDGFLSLVQCRCWIGLHLPIQNEPSRVKIGQIEAKIGEKVCPVSQLTVALRCWAAGLMTQQSSMTSSPCPVPKRFFRPINARELWLLRGFSCVSGNRVDMDTLPELRASTWHDFCIIWGVYNRDTCWVIRGCRAKKTDSKTGHGA